jgi:transcriptional regulator with XRE-family HTH domain
MREILGMTQQALAVAMGKTTVTIARWETSHPPKPGALTELVAFALKQPQSDQLPVRIFKKAIWEPDRTTLLREVDFFRAAADFESAAGQICQNSDRPEMIRHWGKLSTLLIEALTALIRSEQRRRFINVRDIAEWEALRQRIAQFQQSQTTKGKTKK